MLPIAASKKIILTVNFKRFPHLLVAFWRVGSRPAFPLFIGFACSVIVVFVDASVHVCGRCDEDVAFAVLSDVLSASRLFPSIRCRWAIVGVLQSFGGKSSPARISSHFLWLLFCVICKGNCPWFTDHKHCFTDDEKSHQPFMNATWKCALVIGGKVYLAWKQKMLYDVTLHVIGGHQADIHRIIYGKSNFCHWLRPRAVHALRARDDIINLLR